MDPPHGKSYEDGLEMTNDDCSRIGCGLGQSGVDDGAENGEWAVMARRNLNRISYGQISYQIQPSGPHALSGLKPKKD